MRRRIGYCSGPLDAALIRTYMEDRKYAVTITDRLEVMIDLRTDAEAEAARAELLRFRARDCWIEKELETAGYYDVLYGRDPRSDD